MHGFKLGNNINEIDFSLYKNKLDLSAIQISSKFTQIFKFFDSNNNGVLESTEIEDLLNGMVSKAASNNNSIFESDEVEEYLDETVNTKGEKLVSQNISVSDIFNFLKVLQKQNIEEIPENGELTKQELQETAIQTLNNDVCKAQKLFNKQNQEQGPISDSVNWVKELFKTENAASKIDRILLLENLSAYLISKAGSEEGLTQKEYYETKIEFITQLLAKFNNSTDEAQLQSCRDRLKNLSPERIDSIINSVETISDTCPPDKLAGLMKMTIEDQFAQQYPASETLTTSGDRVSVSNLSKDKTIKDLENTAQFTEKMKFEEVFQNERGLAYDSEAINDYTMKNTQLELLLNMKNTKTIIDAYLADYMEATSSSEIITTAKGDEIITELLTKLYSDNKEKIDEIKGLNWKTGSKTSRQMVFFKLQKMANENYEKALNGRSLEEYSRETSDAYIRAYGKNNIKDIVDGYIKSQKEGVGYVKSGVSGAGMLAVIAGQLTPAGGLLASAMIYGGMIVATFGSVGVSAVENYFKKGGPTEEDKKEMVQELTTSLALTASGMGIGKISESVFRLMVLKNCPKLLAYASEVGVDATMSLVADAAITGDIDLSGEGLAQLTNVLTGLIRTKGNLRTYIDTHAGNINKKAPTDPDLSQKSLELDIATEPAVNVPSKFNNSQSFEENLANLRSDFGTPRFDDWDIQQLTELHKKYPDSVEKLLAITTPDGSPRFARYEIENLAEIHSRFPDAVYKLANQYEPRNGWPRFSHFSINSLAELYTKFPDAFNKLLESKKADGSPRFNEFDLKALIEVYAKYPKAVEYLLNYNPIKLSAIDVKNLAPLYSKKPDYVMGKLTEIKNKDFDLHFADPDNVRQIAQAKQVNEEKLLEIAAKTNRSDSEIEAIASAMQKYPEYADGIANLAISNQNIKVGLDLNNNLSKNLDNIAESLKNNPEYHDEILGYMSVQRKGIHDTSDATAGLDLYIQTLKEFPDKKEVIVQLAKNPNFESDDISRYINASVGRYKNDSQYLDDVQYFAYKKYAEQDINRNIQLIRKYPELRDIVVSEGPSYKLIDNNPDTPKNVIESRYAIRNHVEQVAPKELETLRKTLGDDFYQKVKWEDIIPQNATEADIKSILKTLNNESKFFARTAINEKNYGKNIQWAHEMNVISETTAVKISKGESFEDVMENIANSYSEFDKSTTLGSNVSQDARRISSGVYRGNDNPNLEYQTPFNNTDAYAEYFDKFTSVQPANHKSPYPDMKLTTLIYMEDEGVGMMIHPHNKSVNPAMTHVEEKYDELRPLFDKVKNGGTLSKEEVNFANQKISEMYYILANVMPYKRGSNGICDIFMRSAYKALNIDQPALKHGVSLDLESFCVNMDDFTKQWSSFFEF